MKRTAIFVVCCAIVTVFAFSACMAQPLPEATETPAQNSPPAAPARATASAPPSATPSPSPSPTPSPSPSPIEVEEDTPFDAAQTPEEIEAYKSWLAKADETLNDMRTRLPEMGQDLAAQRSFLQAYIEQYAELLAQAETIPVDPAQMGVHEALVTSLRDGIVTAETTLSGLPQP